MSICTYCSKERRIAARGLCGTCYARWQRNGTPEYVRRPDPAIHVSQCTYCHTPDGPFIKTLCRACYQQQYKTGTPERTRVRQLCEMPGCDEIVHSKGFCQKHNMRIRRHGSPDNTRPNDWGTRAKHPLYERWKSMNRGARGRVVPEWSEFWNFVTDVGDPPSAEHRLYRISDAELYGPHNVEWREPIAEYTRDDRDARNAYMRRHRELRPSQHKRAYLKRHYNVSLEWYEEKHKAQGGVCIICGNPETNTHHLTGEVMMLAVDHNKGTGVVRDLLCAGCNTGIGGLKHSIPNLRAAIAYLQHHQQKDA